MARQLKTLAILVGVVALTCAMTAPGFAVDYTWDNGGGASNGMNNPVNYNSTGLPDTMPTDPPEPCAPINGSPTVDGTPQYDNRIYIAILLDGTTKFGGLIDSSMTIDFANAWDNRYYSAGVLTYKSSNPRLLLHGGTAVDNILMTGGSLQVGQLYLGQSASQGGLATISGGTLEVWSRAVIGDGQSGHTEIEGILNIDGGIHSMGSMVIGMGSKGFLNMTGGTLNMLSRETPDASNGPDGVGEFGLPYIRLGEKAGSVGELNLEGGTIYIAQAWHPTDEHGYDMAGLQLKGDYRGWNDTGGTPNYALGDGTVDITEGKMILGSIEGSGTSGDIVDHLLGHVDAGRITAYGYAKGVDDEYGTIYSVIVDYDPAADETTMQAGLVGDLNLDGVVDDKDATILASNMGRSQDARWINGDINYDGAVDADDAAMMGGNWLNSLAAMAAGAGDGAVPEPSSLAMLLGIALAAFTLRRKLAR